MSNHNRINALLYSNPRLALLGEQARLLEQLQVHLDKHLPATLVGHCRVAAFVDGVLTVHADSPAWTAKLRFMTAELLNIFRDLNIPGPVETIRVKARPASPPAEPPARAHRAVLSASTVQMLQHVAAATDDPDLQRSLLRLAENH